MRWQNGKFARWNGEDGKGRDAGEHPDRPPGAAGELASAREAFAICFLVSMSIR